DALLRKRGIENCHARDVAAWPIEPWNQANFDRIADSRKDNWNCRRRCFGCKSRWRASRRKKQRHGQADKFCGQRGQPVEMALRPAECDCEIASLDKSGFAQSLTKGGDHARRLSRRSAAQKPDHRHRRLLRPRRERPARCRAAEEGDEFAAVHSITSSARASSCAGTSIPSCFAVFRLITNSYLVGVCTGR